MLHHHQLSRDSVPRCGEQRPCLSINVCGISGVETSISFCPVKKSTMMWFRHVLNGLLLGSALCDACGQDDVDNREWSREELAELEAKWGFEVPSLS